MKAIETIWKGYRFRSRLEARWAIFFDALGLPWEYEPEGFELSDGRRYLPDFRIVNVNKHTIWYEIKPMGDKGDGKIDQLEKDYQKTCHDYMDDTHNHFLILSGDPKNIIETKEYELCGRCGTIYKNSYKASDYFNCFSCDFNCIHAGGNNPKEWGLITSVSYNKGVLMIDQNDKNSYDLKIERACNASRAARFEHGETPRI